LAVRQSIRQWLEQGYPARSPLNVEISATIPTGLDYAGLFLVQPLALSGENKLPIVRVEHQFPGRLLVFHSLREEALARNFSLFAVVTIYASKVLLAQAVAAEMLLNALNSG
jgi:hypothetical protein